MRNGIKIGIATAFIVGSFLLGKSFCADDCNKVQESFKNELRQEKSKNEDLSDSLRSLNTQLTLFKNQYTSCKNDSNSKGFAVIKKHI